MVFVRFAGAQWLWQALFSRGRSLFVRPPLPAGGLFLASWIRWTVHPRLLLCPLERSLFPHRMRHERDLRLKCLHWPIQPSGMLKVGMGDSDLELSDQMKVFRLQRIEVFVYLLCKHKPLP